MNTSQNGQSVLRCAKVAKFRQIWSHCSPLKFIIQKKTTIWSQNFHLTDDDGDDCDVDGGSGETKTEADHPEREAVVIQSLDAPFRNH